MNVIIVDDHALFRSGMMGIFNAQPDFKVVGEASTIKEALALFEAKKPDLVMMDIGLPDGSGIDAIHRFLKIKENAAIVILTIHASDEHVFRALRLGARGFLLKDISPAGMLNALRGLKHGELAVSRTTLSHFIDQSLPLIVSRTERNTTEVTLTIREIEVLGQLSIADSNLEIARRLSISENTVKIHVHNVLHKLKLRNRQEAADYARRHGLTHLALNQLKDDAVGQWNSGV